MPSRILRTETDRAAWARFLAAQPLPVTVSCIKGAKRSNPQNALFHKWCAQIATATDQSTAEVKAECKLIYGLPIMEAERPEWVAEWEPLYGPLSYAMRRKLFECIPMTSLMTVKQLTAMMDAMQREYRAQGIALVDPEAMKYQAEFE